MITLTYKQLVDPMFMQGASTLWNSQGLDAVTSQRLHRIISKAQKGLEKARALNLEVARKYAEKDEKGELVLSGPQGSNMFKFATPEKMAEFDRELDGLLVETKLVIKSDKVPFQALSNLRSLPPSVWGALAPIVDGLPPDEDEEVSQPNP